MKEIHSLLAEIVSDLLEPVEANTDIPIDLTLRCEHGCSLYGLTARIVDGTGAEVALTELLPLGTGQGVKGRLVFRTPAAPGAYQWKVEVPAQQVDGLEHSGTEMPLSFVVKPHTVSLVVWGVPSVVPVNGRFSISVGIKCLPLACSVASSQVFLHDSGGNELASAIIGEEPFPGTESLQWAAIEVSAPGVEASFSWDLFFPAVEDHAEAHHSITFSTSASPDCTVTVKVSEVFTKDPVPAAIVLVGRYQAETNQEGVSVVRVPKGTYRLIVGRDGYQTHESTVALADDWTIEVELAIGITFADW